MRKDLKILFTLLFFLTIPSDGKGSDGSRLGRNQVFKTAADENALLNPFILPYGPHSQSTPERPYVIQKIYFHRDEEPVRK
jgi:hypothetical protein